MTTMINRRNFLSLAAAGAVAGMLGVTGFASISGAAEAGAFDRAAFDSALAAGGPVLIDISASWCSTCKAQGAAVAKLVKQPEYAGYTIFVVDYDTQKDIMREFGARQRSTLIVFSGGAEAGRIVGDTRMDSIEALLAKGV
ncbi:MAG: thioredoxin domain-containing protein [Bauldia litoralis]